MRKLLQRSVNKVRLALIGMGASGWLLRQGWLGLVETRRYLSSKYLRGHGVEIGALGNPLPLPPGALTFYVDRVAREESQRIYPDASSNPHVEPDRVEDGFALPSIAAESLDFVIGNHVLEHAPDFSIGRMKEVNATLDSFEKSRKVLPFCVENIFHHITLHQEGNPLPARYAGTRLAARHV